MSGADPTQRMPAGSWRDPLIAGGLVIGIVALIAGGVLVPGGRSRLARDPVAQAVEYLRSIQPGMPRKVVESKVRFWYHRNDGADVFEHPDSPLMQIAVRFSGPGQDDVVTSASEPWLGAAPKADQR